MIKLWLVTQFFKDMMAIFLGAHPHDQILEFLFFGKKILKFLFLDYIGKQIIHRLCPPPLIVEGGRCRAQTNM